MKPDLSVKALLVVAIVLLVANLLVTLTVSGATPAHAAERTCVGMSTQLQANGNVCAYRVWSDGTVENIGYR